MAFRLMLVSKSKCTERLTRLTQQEINIFIYVSKMDDTVHITNKSEHYGRMESEDEEILQ